MSYNVLVGCIMPSSIIFNTLIFSIWIGLDSTFCVDSGALKLSMGSR